MCYVCMQIRDSTAHCGFGLVTGCGLASGFCLLWLHLALVQSVRACLVQVISAMVIVDWLVFGLAAAST